MSRKEIDQVVTHSGTFHPDDVFAYSVLKEVFLGPSLVRSRDPRVTCGGHGTIVFDVGGVFDAERRLFDHHHKGKALRGDGTPYSAFGLIWREYGRAFLGRHVPDGLVDEVWERLDQTIVLRIDRVDNGVVAPEELDLIGIVDDFNLVWCDEQKGGAQDKRFEEAADFASGVLVRLIDKELSHIRARDLVRAAAEAAENPAIIVLPASMPYEDVVLGEFPRALYVVSPNADGSEWLCLAVPPEKGSFDQKAPLPLEWAGLRDAELAEISGVPTALFAHPQRFICGATSKDGALALAQTALLFALGRVAVSVGDLSDQEMASILAAEVETDEPCDLADIPDADEPGGSKLG